MSVGQYIQSCLLARTQVIGLLLDAGIYDNDFKFAVAHMQKTRIGTLYLNCLLATSQQVDFVKVLLSAGFYTFL